MAGAGSPLDVAGAIWTLVRTDFKVRYHGALLGFFWAMLKPLAMFLALMSVFSFVFADKTHYPLNLILGLFLYDFFGEGTRTGLASLHARGYLISRSRFPRWILVVTSTSNALITVLFASAAVVSYMFITGRGPSPVALLLYLTYLLQFLMIIVGFSLAASVLFVRYRDLNQVWDLATQAGFFFAPVIYPLEILPERYHAYLYVWPPTPVIQFAREVLVAGTVPTLKAHALLLGLSLFCLVGGAVVHRLLVRRVGEYL